MADGFVRARCADTGAVAALPKAALDAGMLPGWAEVDGPAPATPKPATFRPPPADTEEPNTEEPNTDTADTTAGTESADSSAEQKE